MGKRFAILICVAAAVAVALPSQAGAAFPGENGQIAFASDLGNAPNHWDIWKINDPATYDGSPSRAAVTRLTNDEKDNQLSPSFSPDGRKIVYVAEFRGGDKEIMLMNSDGTDKKRLTSNARQDRQPVFSPDGARIAFASSRSGETEIWIMRADGTGAKRLTDFAAIDKTTGRSANPHFSPDGSQVFFQGTTYNNVPWGDDAVYRTDSHAGGPEHPTRTITLHGLYDMRGFGFNASGTQWAYGVRESFQTQVTANPLHALDPRWGPFNLYVSPAEGGCGYCAGGAKYSFPGRKIIATKKSGNPEDFFTPVYAPAGDRVLFVARLQESGSKPYLAALSVSDPSKVRPFQMDISNGHASQIQPDWGPRPRP
jgi:hypothetical protein